MHHSASEENPVEKALKLEVQAGHWCIIFASACLDLAQCGGKFVLDLIINAEA